MNISASSWLSLELKFVDQYFFLSKTYARDTLVVKLKICRTRTSAMNPMFLSSFSSLWAFLKTKTEKKTTTKKMILIANWEGTDCQIISVLHSVEIKTQIMLCSFRGVQFTTLPSRSKLKLTCFCFFIFQRQKLATFDSCKRYFCSCAETKTYNPDSLFFSSIDVL